jgi:hypothetical protein
MPATLLSQRPGVTYTNHYNQHQLCKSITSIAGSPAAVMLLASLQTEHVRTIEPVAVERLSAEQGQTLLCFVLVDPAGRHAFCRWAT